MPLNPEGMRYEPALLPHPGWERGRAHVCVARSCVLRKHAYTTALSCRLLHLPAFSFLSVCLAVSWSVRFPDEWVRHKALDCVGDLALAGAPLHAHFYGTLCGHELNCQLLNELFADEANYAVLHDSPTTPFS